MEDELLFLHPVGGGKHLERLGKIVLQLLAQKTDPGDLRQGDALKPRGSVERKEVRGDRVLSACGHLARLHSDNGARDLCSAGEGRFHGFPARLRQERRQGRVLREVQGEAFESTGDGVPRRVGDAGNGPAIHVTKDKALQEVVDLAGGKGELHAGVPVHHAVVLEVPDAAGEQHEARERNHGVLFLGLRCRGKRKRGERKQREHRNARGWAREPRRVRGQGA